jgi:hypothetical protein
LIRTETAIYSAGHLKRWWLTQPVTLAALCQCGDDSVSYSRLKKALCPSFGCRVMAIFNKTPLLAAERQRLWSQADTRLLVAKAKVSTLSDSEPTIESCNR